MGLLHIKNLCFKYKKDVLKNIGFAAVPGSFTALLGINGAGKSTLLKNINGILRPYTGCVLVEGCDINKMSKNGIAQKIAYTAQSNAAAHTTVYDSILIGRKPYIRLNATKNDHKIVCEIIEYLQLSDYALRYTDELSGGELQKVIAARALAQEPRILLMDEPTAGLDLKNQLDVMDSIKTYCTQKGIAAIVSIHDINLSLRYADSFLLLKDGKVFACGGQEIITAENIRKAYSVDAEIYTVQGKIFVVPLRQTHKKNPYIQELFVTDKRSGNG